MGVVLLDFARFGVDEESGSIGELPRVIGAEYQCWRRRATPMETRSRVCARSRCSAPLARTPAGICTARDLRRTKRALAGSFVSFAHTKAEREANRDSRRSLEERTHDNLGAAVRAAANRFVTDRLLPSADRERLIAQAQASDCRSKKRRRAERADVISCRCARNRRVRGWTS